MMKTKIAAVAMLLATATPFAAVQSQPLLKGAMYAFRTPAAGACPGLDWHAYVEGDNSITGYVTWDRMRHSASFDGKVGSDGSFALSAKETGGTRTAVITGKVTTGKMTLMIDGTGTACDKQSWSVQRAPDYAGGGSG